MGCPGAWAREQAREGQGNGGRAGAGASAGTGCFCFVGTGAGAAQVVWRGHGLFPIHGAAASGHQIASAGTSRFQFMGAGTSRFQLMDAVRNGRVIITKAKKWPSECTPQNQKPPNGPRTYKGENGLF